MTPEQFFNARIIKQESGGKQFGRNGEPLTSSAGAVGIAQVMPGTAPEAAKMAGIQYDEQKFRYDPEYNATLGRAYYKNMYDRYGSHELASAAYNAGPGNVDSAIAKAKQTGRPVAEFLPSETRAYVPAVMGGGQGGFGQVAMSGKGQQQGAPDKKGASNLFGMSDDSNYALLMASLRMMGTPGNVGMGLAAAGDTYAKTLAQQKQLNREQMTAEAEANLKGEQAASQRVTSKGYTTQVRTQNPDGTFRVENQVVAPGSTATFNTQSAQGGAGGQGGVGPQGSTGGGPQAPQGPQMPQQEIDALGPRAVGDTGENKFNVLQELGRQAIQANAGDEENAKKMFNEQYKDVYSNAKAAQGGRGDLAAVVKSVSELPSGGLTGFGPGSEARLNFARYINAGLRTFGDSGFDENNISNQQILQKVATLNANEGGNSIAARWLSQYANAFPNADQSEAAAKNLTAQLLVANTRHQDAQRVADVYGRHSLRMGTELNNAMERVNPTELYAYAKNDIANLMIRRSVQDPVTGKLKNPVSALMAGDITPAEFNDYAKRNGSKIENLSHFVLGR
jgi:hypothetical protein